jgi:light-regulated signal transduction histidine kinase (bacteriophytochrome)
MGSDAARDEVVPSIVVSPTCNERSRQPCVTAAPELEHLSFLSHDLNNSVSAVGLHRKLLKQRLDAFPQPAPELSRADRAQRLCSRPIRLCLRLVDLHDLAVSVAALFAETAAAKGLRLRIEIPSQTVVQTDPDLLVAVLQNLIGNSVKYSERGTVRVCYRALGDPPWAGWVVSVSDNGHGIPPPLLPDIFFCLPARGDSRPAGQWLGTGNRPARDVPAWRRVVGPVGSRRRIDLSPRDPIQPANFPDDFAGTGSVTSEN